MFDFRREIEYVKGVGEKTAEKFHRLGVFTLGALLSYYPKSYDDFTDITPLSEVKVGDIACIKATVTSEIKKSTTKNRKAYFKFTVYDKTGVCDITVFGNQFLEQTVKQDGEYIFRGKFAPPYRGGKFMQLISPEIRTTERAYIRPNYRLTAGLKGYMVERAVKSALEYLDDDDYMPQDILSLYRLADLKTALNNIHFPKSAEDIRQARRRLVFDELFVLRLGQMIIKRNLAGGNAVEIKNNHFDEFCALLPFTLTDGQKKACADCFADMSKPTPMNRLLEGDVGCGKTAVAAALVYAAAKNRQKSVLMAPTSVLAHQHYLTFTKLLPNLKTALLTGAITPKEKAAIREGYKSGQIDLLIGTHAVIADKTDLSGTALCITDEQHRFGVNQRTALRGKSGGAPHTLVMSATPIPRTLSMTVYGDLDISIIQDKPHGRIPPKTYLIDNTVRSRAFGFIKKQIAQGFKAYIVCPLVEDGGDESEKVSAQKYYDIIKTGYFADTKTALLHGKMSSKEKDRVLDEFANGDTMLLIATTVVEVGVDVREATVMMVENAEQFGLSTLHQLRGRIGRNNTESHFIMVSSFNSERLDVLCKTTDGFEIAKADLKLRGPGDFLGERQHGLPDLKLAQILSDTKVLECANKQAAALLERDEGLLNHPLLLDKIDSFFENNKANIL